ncbi:DNA mismatch repair protein [Hymenobacter glaciei]|uniref:DNA mismatch repair protein n=1 Tax=Hymenobacter glaciei TaxID=877209 RepID=A0ABP7UPC5_9BACT
MWTSSATRLAALEAEWQQPSPRFRNFPLVARYHQQQQAGPAWHRLDDQTWHDLNGEELFALLDGTVSRVGQQCLYNRLRTPLAEAGALQEFDEAAALFTAQPAARGGALLALSRLQSMEAYYLTDLLAGIALPALPLAAAAPVLVLLLLATLVGGFWLPVLWFFTAGQVLAHTVLHYFFRSRVVAGTRPMLQLGNLYRAGRELAPLGLSLPALRELAGPLTRLGAIVSKVAFLQFEGQLQSDIAALPWLILQYVKILLLLDFIVYHRCRRDVQAHAGAIRAVFEAVGYADCAVAVAGFRARQAHCVPEFTTAGLRLTDAYNPLVAGCVPNTLTVDSRSSVLLTGSNMSGKTTFMRTIGLNTLLAQTITTCPASTYAAPFRRVVSSVNLADSLPEGKSYYFAEAEAVLGFVRAAEAKPGEYLFVLDELFKGTNTVERIAATKAVLAYLQSRSLVVASTHDGELGALLAPAFTEYHFSETVSETDWYFDYSLKLGPLTTRNGIRLLARAGYPSAIVDDALALSRTLDAAADARETAVFLP